MTVPPSDFASHHAAVVVRAAHKRGLDTGNLRLLHQHATAVYLLPHCDVVARLHTGDPAPALRAVAITRWLNDQDFPAVAPLPGVDPVIDEEHVTTFWHHYPASHPPAHADPADLGRLLRRLHGLPPAPLELPAYHPLVSLRAALANCTCLTDTDRTWLTDTAATLLADFERLDFPLGRGQLHGDAYPGNMLHDPSTGTWLLSDWDETATGPRELDLANTYQGVRVGRTTADLDRFATAYGHDLRTWPGLATLIRIRDLHTLGSFIHRADQGDQDAATELRHRLHVLRHAGFLIPWHHI
ncbi:phosphotransferase [Actinokineospora spheciospongiae]|uniref:phosphotransferase n=1 Tax=Actinokineospora spheciospongiae TaxID=909613 RepID=UPI0004BB7B0E|nr:aminoglycoside phosphotransferase family protein [Actinokineospora spheciospongiae]